VNLKRYFRLSVLLLAVVGLAACNNSYGIFSSIQGESKNTNTSAFYQTAVVGLAAYNGNYYARLQTIYTRPASSAAGSDWAYLEPAAFGTDYVCTGLAATSSDLYVAIRNGRGSTSTARGIYKLDSSGTWSQAYNGTENIQALYSANDQVFAATMDSTSDSGSIYSLKHLNGSALEATGIASVTTMPTNGVHDGTNYWFAAGTKLYKGASETALSEATAEMAAANSPSGSTITCLATDSVNGSPVTAIFIGTSSGYVYRYASPTWANALATSGTSYAVTAMLAVPTGTTGSGRALLVGNSLSGYYEADVTSSLGSFTTGGSSTIVTTASVYESSLTNMPVFAFVYDGTATSGTLFACASATAVDYTGLWSNKRTTTWAGWASE
jgi:hypothetical protein